MRQRKVGRNKLKNQKMFIIIGTLSIMMFLTVGYAAFQTTINMNVTGNVKEPPVLKNATTVIADKLSDGDTTLFTDGNGNIRYSGADNSVNNYVCLADETPCQSKNLYRIIGSFANVDNGSGTTQTRLKVIKATDIGEYKQWHTTDTTTGWAQPVSLNTYLNSTYYTNQMESNNLIDNAKWKLGNITSRQITAAQAYSQEHASGASTWTGKIGLMDVSDYAYASSACRTSTTLKDYHSSTCTTTNYLSGFYEWLLTYDNNASIAYSIRDAIYSYYECDGICADVPNLSTDELSVRPVAYLKAETKLKTFGRTGTSTNPYIAKLDSNSGS